MDGLQAFAGSRAARVYGPVPKGVNNGMTYVQAVWVTCTPREDWLQAAARPGGGPRSLS
jgi:hypothetical protein